MKRWLFSAGFILLLLLAGFFYASPPVNAQTTDEDQSSATGANNNNNNNGGTPDGTANNPWKINYTKDDFDAYNKAVSETGCSTPSLECLVRNTVRFVAIEWVQEIMGPNMYVNFDGGSVDPNDPRYGGIDQQSSTSQPGIIGSVFGLIGSMYAYQPAATNRYVAYVLDEADLAPPAYAQGVGFAALDPVLNLWKMFRNVAYFFFIGVFIVIGFMIMFRQKISGQAAITAQQAIPSIIVSLILVTFSYAIAGFLIDLMYLFMFMLVYVFNYTSGTGNSAILAASSVQWNIGELGAALMGAAWNPANNAGFVETLLSNFEGTSGGWLSNGVFSWMGGLTLSLVLAIAVLIGMVKLFFELLKSYASIIMGVIFAPFYLMLGAFPGKNTFVPWLRNMVGNLAAFPTVLLFVMLFQVFTSESVFRDGFGGGFMPPYLIGGGQSSAAAYLLGLGIILALEPIVKEIKKRMGASDGGFGMMVAKNAYSGIQEGVKGKYGIPGAKWPLAVPSLVLGKYQLGPETSLENKLWGSRAARVRNDEIERLGGRSKPLGWMGVFSRSNDQNKGRESGANTATQNASLLPTPPTITSTTSSTGTITHTVASTPTQSDINKKLTK